MPVHLSHPSQAITRQQARGEAAAEPPRPYLPTAGGLRSVYEYVPVTKEATLNDVDAPPGLPPALATAPHLHIANRVSLGPRAGYAPFTGAAAEGDVILSVDSGSRMACFDALCDIQPLCVHLDLGYGTSNSIFGRFCEREGMDHDTVGPAGGVFRAVKSCKLAFVHGQMLGRRLV